MTKTNILDQADRFLLQDFSQARPFASFLPGIAGRMGVPMWVFYVNRGQAIAGFGVENKDNPIMEFEPANKAYQNTATTGFRTFLKLQHGERTTLYEPFSPWNTADSSMMVIGLNELELQTTSAAHGIQTSVLYFTLPGEPFSGLVRQVTVTNTGKEPLQLELLDGMPRVMPYGVDNHSLKEMGRTIEAVMSVFNLEQGIPFYRLQASAADSAEVKTIRSGHFYLAFDASGQLLMPFVDPSVVFGQNTALSFPDQFIKSSLAELSRRSQITSGRTPCGLFGLSAELDCGDSLAVYAIIGHVGNLEHLQREKIRLADPDYVHRKRQEANQLVNQLIDPITTQTSSHLFNAYARQTFLDNVLRGGWPIILGSKEKPIVYHIYSRKHGDLERDYNYFYLAAEPYSQGNANFRDVNQNRRCDVLFKPEVGNYNVLSFLGLIQADGYNPLVVEGSRFTLPLEQRAAILSLVNKPDLLAPVLTQSFTPGQLLRTIADGEIGLKVEPESFVAAVLEHAVQQFEAAFGEGYWIDHWFYNLDLIETYLSVFPDKEYELLFNKPVVPTFESPAFVEPRSRKYVLVDGGVRQYGAIVENEEKVKQISSRSELPNLARESYGSGDVFRTTVFSKLVGLAVIKFTTLDPLGMGVEMEAGKPGWYDALNGLPGLFGSSLCETYELERLLTFLLQATANHKTGVVELPVEQHTLLREALLALDTWKASPESDRDFHLWDTISAAREAYRESVRFGFDGKRITLTAVELAPLLEALLKKVRAGIQRAVEMNDGVPPTYFTYKAGEYDFIYDAKGQPLHDSQGRPYVRVKSFEPVLLPLFLEGPVHALKVARESASARDLYQKIKETDLYDRKLGMYKVNASLADQTHEIGRARAFTPGWLENESIFLHMEYKYLLEVLRAGLYDEFFEDFQKAGILFQDPTVYGRSPLENSSFLVSSAHPDASLHGAGFVARLSGATAEFLSMWNIMMAGKRPFCLKDGELCLDLRPALPGWLFDDEGKITFTFLGHTQITYHNPSRLDTWKIGDVGNCSALLHLPDNRKIGLPQQVISSPFVEMVRSGKIRAIDLFFWEEANFGSDQD